MLRWTVRLSPQAEAKINTAIGIDERFEDVVMALKWRLARDPRKGAQIVTDRENAYLIKFTPPVPDLPSILALYTFDQSEVYVIDVRIKDQK